MDCSNISASIPCKIGNCIQKVVGIYPSSSSPSIQLIVNFKDGVKASGEPVAKGFLKIFVRPDHIEPDNRKNFEGLQYEILFYKHVTNPLLDNLICPNFVRYFGGHTHCSYKDIMNVLVDKTSDEQSLLSASELDKNLLKNLEDNILLKKGKAIQVKREQSIGWNEEVILYIRNKVKFGFLLTEYIEGGILKSFLTNADDTRLIDTRGSGRIPREGWRMLFQIMCGCYALFLSRAIDNDLHMGNVLIQNYTGPPRIYDVEGNIYELKSSLNALIFDFDNSYAERLGPNPLLVGKRCEKSSHCNILVPNKDMVKLLCYFYKKFNNNQGKVTDELLSVLLKRSGREHTKTLLRDVVYEGGCFLLNKNNTRLPETIYDEFVGPAEIIHKVAAKAGMKLQKLPPNFSYYRIDSEMFNGQGEIKPEFVTNGRSQKFSRSFLKFFPAKKAPQHSGSANAKKVLDDFNKVLRYCQNPDNPSSLDDISFVVQAWTYGLIKDVDSRKKSPRQQKVFKVFREKFARAYEFVRGL